MESEYAHNYFWKQIIRHHFLTKSSLQCVNILGPSCKIAKSEYYVYLISVCLSFCLSLSLSVPMEQLGSQWTNVHKILH